MAILTPRKHQKQAIAAILANVIGQVILPTGTGKTIVEAETIVARIKENIKLGKHPGIYMVLSPRIILTFQLLLDIGKQIAGRKIESLYLNVNSGEFRTREFEQIQVELGFENTRAIPSTTNAAEIATQMKAAIDLNLPLIIGATYHSAEQVEMAPKCLDIADNRAKTKMQSLIEQSFEIIIYDEAQYTVGSNGGENDFARTARFKSKRKYFFTATPKHTTGSTDTGNGMNNEEIFGKELIRKSPREMIEAGEMVKPAIQLFGIKNDNADYTDNFDMQAEIIKDAFIEHRKVLAEHSANPDKLGGKIIVTCDGQMAVEGIWSSPRFAQLRKDLPGVKILMLCTDFGMYLDKVTIQGENGPEYMDNRRITADSVRNRDKENLLRSLKALKDEDEAIVIHVDMLSEGLDVPGVTGIMPFRNWGKTKFLQNLGRGTRLNKDDRQSLYDGLIQAEEFSKYIKPYCWLIIPVITTAANDFVDTYSEYIAWLRSDYKFDSTDMIIVDNSNAASEIEAMDEVGGINKKIRTFQPLRDRVVEFVKQCEDMDLMNGLETNLFDIKRHSDDTQAVLLYKLFDAHSALTEVEA